MSDTPLLLGLDFGTAKVGVAIGSIAPTLPIEVIRYTSQDELLKRLSRLVEVERPEGVIIGWPADHVTQSTVQTDVIQHFGEQVGQLTGLPVVYYPETLSTQHATQRMLAEGIAKTKRRLVEDSYAAAGILDSYLLSL